MLDGLAETLIVYGKIGGQGKYIHDNGHNLILSKNFVAECKFHVCKLSKV